MSKLFEEKIELGKFLKETLEKRISRLQRDIREIENSRDTNSKSTAGDKHETSRAMAQNELEKLAQQLTKAKQEFHHLSQIDLKKKSSKVEVGSFVETSTGKYFLAIGLGIVELNDSKIFVVSPAAPVGQGLLKLKVDDVFSAGGVPAKILEIS